MDGRRHAGLLVRPADGRAITNPIGGRMVVKVRDAETHGAYSNSDRETRSALPVIVNEPPVQCPP